MTEQEVCCSFMEPQSPALEARLSIQMGKEERYRVARASLTAAHERSVSKAVEYAVARERGRCLAIAGLWPDNLMAKEIAKRIRGGA